MNQYEPSQDPFLQRLSAEIKRRAAITCKAEVEAAVRPLKELISKQNASLTSTPEFSNVASGILTPATKDANLGSIVGRLEKALFEALLPSFYDTTVRIHESDITGLKKRVDEVTAILGPTEQNEKLEAA